ncbi:MAG: type II toxin-antitoxin system VapC family toxin [Chloroflexota bacterium]
MIVYFDTSALIKRYVDESGSEEVIELLSAGESIWGSVFITQVEMAAALQKSIHVGNAPADLLLEIWQDFQEDWGSFTHILISGDIVARAVRIAWDYKLRGYDSIHLAAALAWQEALAASITFATYDRDLWQAARKAGMEVWPAGLVDG